MLVNFRVHQPVCNYLGDYYNTLKTDVNVEFIDSKYVRFGVKKGRENDFYSSKCRSFEGVQKLLGSYIVFATASGE